MLSALREVGMPLSHIVINAVALSGRLSLQQLLSLPITEQQRPKPTESDLSFYKPRCGSTLEGLLKAQSCCTFDGDARTRAAARGQLAALQRIFRESSGCHDEPTASTAASGVSARDLFLQQNPISQSIDSSTVMATAASAGHIAICEYLRSIGCGWNASACSRAASVGHLDTLRWLRVRGCPWDVSELCISAACNGFIDILDYVIEQGEVLDAEVLAQAVTFADFCNQPQAAEWLQRHSD
jgi:hypothetical protein